MIIYFTLLSTEITELHDYHIHMTNSGVFSDSVLHNV